MTVLQKKKSLEREADVFDGERETAPIIVSGAVGLAGLCSHSPSVCERLRSHKREEKKKEKGSITVGLGSAQTSVCLRAIVPFSLQLLHFGSAKSVRNACASSHRKRERRRGIMERRSCGKRQDIREGWAEAVVSVSPSFKRGEKRAVEQRHSITTKTMLSLLKLCRRRVSHRKCKWRLTFLSFVSLLEDLNCTDI